MMKYHTFESEDGDLAVRRCAGEDGTQLVGSP
jgi:hypothetical protein